MIQVSNGLFQIACITNQVQNLIAKLPSWINLSNKMICKSTSTTCCGKCAPFIEHITDSTSCTYYLVIDATEGSICNDLCIIDDCICQARKRLSYTLRRTVVSFIKAIKNCNDSVICINPIVTNITDLLTG